MIKPYYKEENITIYCGDCLEVMKELPDESIDLVLTDPPYAISQNDKEIKRNYKHYNWKRESNIKLDFGKWDHFKNDKDFFNFTELWFRETVRCLKDKGWIYIFFDKQKIGYFDLFFAPKLKLKSRCIFVWIKSNPTPSFRKMNWVSATEFCWVGSKGESRIKNFKLQKEMNNYFITTNKSSYGETKHPTEKPLKLLRHLIEINSNPSDTILDPFLGSGTTARACKDLGRKCIGIGDFFFFFMVAQLYDTERRYSYYSGWIKRTQVLPD